MENLKPSENRDFFIDSETEVGKFCQGCDPGSEFNLALQLNKSIWIDITSYAIFGWTDSSVLSIV